MPGSLPFRRLLDLFRRLLDRLPRRTTAGFIAGLAALSTVVATIGFGAASARDDDLIGQPVSDEQLAVIVAAAESCPMLNPARVAGQLMAESGLDAGADTTTSGGQGIAGLDSQDWQDWAPWPAAERADVEANVIALARQMCQLSGRLRVAEVPGDQWWLALAAFHTGLDTVTDAGGVPDPALTYVGQASGYAAYYSKLPQFGGSGDEPADTNRQPKAIPTEYVELIVEAGSACPAVTAPAVAASLMALSGFDATLVGADDRQGIAQFTTELWQEHGPADASPMVPAAAIPAFGTAMCALVESFGDAEGDVYLMALAAYHAGVDAVRQTDGPLDKETENLLESVQRLTDFYAMDARMTTDASPSPSATPSPSASSSPSTSPTPAASPTGSPKSRSATTPPGTASTRPAAPPPSPRATKNPPKQTTPAAPPAPVRPSNTYQLVGKETGLCVSAGAGSDGTRLTLQRCAENKSQWWQLRSDGTIRANGLCMDVAWGASEDGTPVQVAYCSGHPAQNWQKWQGRSGTLVNPLTGKCLDVDGHGVGSPLMIWYCVGHPKQTFNQR